MIILNACNHTSHILHGLKFLVFFYFAVLYVFEASAELLLYLFSFVETPRKFIIAELTNRKLGSSSVLIILLLLLLLLKLHARPINFQSN